MAISQGKLVLYTLFGGIHPARTLPIVLDVGTNNPALLKDPLYLGWRHPRITGKEYDEFVDTFVQAIKSRFPKVLLQWEDFAKPHARALLDLYREKICSFNDDIQGTAAVVLAAILSALKFSGKSLKSQKFAILGGGSAGIGIAQLIYQAMRLEGCPEEQARRSFYIIDVNGLVHTQMYNLEPELEPFAQPHSSLSSWNYRADKEVITLLDVVNNAQPTVLIGVCAQPNMFTEEIVKTMASYCEQPIILPLSNPTSRSEAHPQDLVRWTQAKALIATGSPFDPVVFDGKKYTITQCNNVYIFPGIGLGAIVAQTPKIIDKMFIAAAHILSNCAPASKDPSEGLFPQLGDLGMVSRAIAKEIIQIAEQEGLIPMLALSEREKQLDEKIWFPQY